MNRLRLFALTLVARRGKAFAFNDKKGIVESEEFGLDREWRGWRRGQIGTMSPNLRFLVRKEHHLKLLASPDVEELGKAWVQPWFGLLLENGLLSCESPPLKSLSTGQRLS